MTREATVFVVDNDTLSRNSAHDVMCRMNLRCQTYASGQRFLDEYDRSLPGCLVCELQIPDVSGLAIQQQLISEGATLPVVFLTEHATVAIVVRAMSAGAVHFMTKPLQEDELWETVQKAVNLDRQRRALLAEREKMKQRFSGLTRREREVWQLWMNDHDEQAIAERLGVTVRAVEHRQNSTLRKLGIRTSLKLLRLCDEVLEDAPSRVDELLSGEDACAFHRKHGLHRSWRPNKAGRIKADNIMGR